MVAIRRGAGDGERTSGSKIIEGEGKASSSTVLPPITAVVENNDVSHQELDAMKRMVRDMIHNPDLLHISPVYSRSVVAKYNMANYYPISTASAAAATSSFRRRSVGGGGAVAEDALTSSRLTAATTTAAAAAAATTRRRAASYSLQRQPYLSTISPSDDDELELLRRRRRMLVQSSSNNNDSIALATACNTIKDSKATDDDDDDAIIATNDTNNDNINSSSPQFVSRDLCHECSNSTSMLFELEKSEKRREVMRRNSTCATSRFDDNYLTMSAPQPTYRTRRQGRGGDEGVEAQIFQQMQQWRRPLQVQQILQKHQYQEVGMQLQQLQLDDEDHEQRDHRLQSFMAVASPTDNVNVNLDRERGRRGEEGEDATMDNNCSSDNLCKRNHRRRTMATMIPPLPFVPPPEER